MPFFPLLLMPIHVLEIKRLVYNKCNVTYKEASLTFGISFCFPTHTIFDDGDDIAAFEIFYTTNNLIVYRNRVGC